MGLGPVHCLAYLLVLLFCHGRGIEQRAQEGHGGASRQLLAGVTRLEPARDMPELDVSTPLATVPVVNPTAVPTTPLASATPSLANPAVASGGGGSWCVASPSAGATALQVALDYACGQGGADCSAIQPGGSCANPDTVRDHASYAFNSYYQKNPVQTSCDFAGTAILTSTDPSTSTCKFPATSTGASVLNTTNPTTPNFAPNFGSPPGYGNSPPGYGNSPPLYGSMSPPDYGGGISAGTAMPDSKRTVMTCLLVATVSLNTIDAAENRCAVQACMSQTGEESRVAVAQTRLVVSVVVGLVAVADGIVLSQYVTRIFYRCGKESERTLACVVHVHSCPVPCETILLRRRTQQIVINRYLLGREKKKRSRKGNLEMNSAHLNCRLCSIFNV